MGKDRIGKDLLLDYSGISFNIWGWVRFTVTYTLDKKIGLERIKLK